MLKLKYGYKLADNKVFLKNYFDGMAQFHQRSSEKKVMLPAIIDGIKKFIPQGKTVHLLDISITEGYAPIALKHKLRNAYHLEFDYVNLISPDIDRPSSIQKEARTVFNSLDELLNAKTKYDIVLLFHSVYYFSEQPLLKMVLKKLKANGVICMVVYSPDGDQASLQRLFGNNVARARFPNILESVFRLDRSILAEPQTYKIRVGDCFDGGGKCHAMFSMLAERAHIGVNEHDIKLIGNYLKTRGRDQHLIQWADIIWIYHKKLFPSHTRYMDEAIRLARKSKETSGHGVGAVLVDLKTNQIISKGYRFEKQNMHAEFMAIAHANLKKNQKVALYTTLEPCSYRTFNDTSCLSKILDTPQIKEVYIAGLDPNPLIYRNSIKLLKAKGIKVTFGIGAKVVFNLNKAIYKKRYHFAL